MGQEVSVNMKWSWNAGYETIPNTKILFRWIAEDEQHIFKSIKYVKDVKISLNIDNYMNIKK